MTDSPKPADSTTGGSSDQDVERVRTAIRDELRTHVRIADQGNDLSDDARRKLAETLPAISAFGDKSFHSVRAILDWDHQIPSQYALLRIMGCYTAEEAGRIDTLIAERDEDIGETNLYPEFDLPDFGDIDAGENYVAILRTGSTEVEDFRFLSMWRKNVTPSVGEAALKAVGESDSFKKVAAGRRTEGLGGPVVIGWTPPCLAESDAWAIEIWLLTEFDGHAGKARVFMVDSVSKEVTREFDTDVQLA